MNIHNLDSNSNLPVIYITGFGPFGEHSINSSQKLVEKLAGFNIESQLHVKLQTDILDVAYDSVIDKVRTVWSSSKPKLVIHIGVSALASEIVLEKQAFNCDYVRQDIKSCFPSSTKCRIGYPDCLESELDLEKIVEEVEKQDGCHLKCSISHDPGRYLCGFVYYLSLSISKCRSLFIHVPTLERVCEDSEEAAVKLAGDVAFIMKCLYKQVQELEAKEDIKA